MKTRSIATAGMISDTSLYNVDGACVVGDSTAIPVGYAVGVTLAEQVDGHKVVGVGGVPYGVVVKSHYETPDGTARAKEAVNVLTHGRIWMPTELSARPGFGSVVTIGTDGTPGDDGTATAWKYAGGFIPAADGNPALVEVQVLQSSTAVV